MNMDTLIISSEIFGATLLVAAMMLSIFLRRYEVAVAVVIILGATLWHADIAGRWEESNIKAEEFAKRFQNVPIEVGDWEGVDLEVSEEVKKGSGAVGYVSRIYTNRVTGEQVQFWLIVGHARDICRHEPTTCYPSHGARQRHEPRRQKISYGRSEPAEFWMTIFELDQSSQVDVEDHVLWAWAKPAGPGEPPPNWVAPKVPRMTFRNTKALYKMYFTSHVMKSSSRVKKETIAALDFAPIFIPEVNRALFTESYPAAESEAETVTDSAPAN